MVHFRYLNVRLSIENVSGRLLHRMDRMDMDWNT